MAEREDFQMLYDELKASVDTSFGFMDTFLNASYGVNLPKPGQGQFNKSTALAANELQEIRQDFDQHLIDAKQKIDAMRQLI